LNRRISVGMTIAVFLIAMGLIVLGVFAINWSNDRRGL
jgi:hypothetical protein